MSTAPRRIGEKARNDPQLVFTHYCGKTKKGYFKVKRRTSRKKLGASLRALADWAKRARRKLTKGEMLRRAKARVKGHLNDYAPILPTNLFGRHHPGICFLTVPLERSRTQSARVFQS